MKYLVFGKNGQLARAFIRRFESDATEYVAVDHSRGDITDPGAVEDLVASLRPSVILNCAAYNLVDKAEQDREAAFRVNRDGPAYLARAAYNHGALLVHYGTDYVFDGTKENGLYTEGDGTNPLSVYGRSKLEGEQKVEETAGRHLIFRLSWVFGEGNQNFIAKLLDWTRRSDYLRITCDEFSVPTWTHTVVEETLKAASQGITGLYHLTNGGYCSRYEWAKLVLEEQGIRTFIRPVTMDAFPLPAARPKFSAMSNGAVSRLLGTGIPPWQDAVRAFLREGHF